MHRVLVYELNEVPWEILDLYLAARPTSELAALVDGAMCRTTRIDETEELMPWRTWPSMHRSMLTAQHNSFDQGQDPATFRGVPIWDAADAGGRKVGLFGSLQSWPAHPFANGGFYVPDSFARTAETVPADLERFQRFNTSMTNENGFAPTDRLDPGQLARTGADLLRRGLRPWSIQRLVRHLVDEKRDHRYVARRAAMQVLPCFDLWWKLHRQHRPDLSIFFTNHVASMMHRFWGDWVPAYAQSEDYRPDPVYRTFILTALDLLDNQIGVLRRWLDEHPDDVLVLLSSMGQAAIPFHRMDATFVLDEPEKLVGALGLGTARNGLAMYPRITLEFDDEGGPDAALGVIASAETDSGPLFRDLRVKGRSLSFELAYQHDLDDLGATVRYRALGSDVDATSSLEQLGISIRSRPGGGNTAQHVPEGMFIAAGARLSPDRSREKVDLLDVAPSILELLDVTPPAEMVGRPGVFEDAVRS